eukprot:COSAG06_NODE_3508_length_5257_cov_2.595967_4_plen_93_part_00
MSVAQFLRHARVIRHAFALQHALARQQAADGLLPTAAHLAMWEAITIYRRMRGGTARWLGKRRNAPVPRPPVRPPAAALREARCPRLALLKL